MRIPFPFANVWWASTANCLWLPYPISLRGRQKENLLSRLQTDDWRFIWSASFKWLVFFSRSSCPFSSSSSSFLRLCSSMFVYFWSYLHLATNCTIRYVSLCTLIQTKKFGTSLNWFRKVRSKEDVGYFSYDIFLSVHLSHFVANKLWYKNYLIFCLLIN